jgi:hypothetical protein
MRIIVVAFLLALGATAQGQFIYKSGKSTAKMDTLKANNGTVKVVDNTGTWTLTPTGGGLDSSKLVTKFGLIPGIFIGNATLQVSEGESQLTSGLRGILDITDDQINIASTGKNPSNVYVINVDTTGFSYNGNLDTSKWTDNYYVPWGYIKDHKSQLAISSGATSAEDTIYISSANILSGINDTLIHTNAGTTQTIYTTCLINYRHVSAAYTGGTTDTIAVFGKYKGIKKKLLYISSTYITDAYSGRGQFPIAWDKLDPGSPIWVHIPAFSTGNGILRMRFKKIVESW